MVALKYIKMPYFIKESGKGYKVCKTKDKKKCFSKKPLTKNKAIKQMRAIYMSEFNKIA